MILCSISLLGVPERVQSTFSDIGLMIMLYTSVCVQYGNIIIEPMGLMFHIRMMLTMHADELLCPAI